MKKFKFSLEKVKELRETQEKLIQRELAVAQQKLYFAENKRDRVIEEIDEQSQKRTTDDFTNSHKIMLVIKYIESLEEKLSSLNKEINQLEEKISEIRERLVQKVKEKKTLEKLRDIKKMEYQKLTKKKEQDMMDEVSSQNYVKQQRINHE